MAIEAKVTNNQITATVGETKIDVAVGGGVGPTGSQGSSGVVTVSAPLVNGGTASAAQLSLSVGAGLQVSGGSLVLGSHTHALSALTQSGATTNQVIAWNGTAWAPATVAAGSSAWNDITGKPNEFPPAYHIQSTDTITTVSGDYSLTNIDAFIDAVANDGYGAALANVLGGALVGHTHLAADMTFAASDRLLGRSTGGGGAGQEITCTSFGRSLLDDANASAARSTLELGTAATSSTGDFAAASHSHGSITSGGAIGTTSGLVVTTGASGVLGALAQGTAGQVLKVNSGATGVEWGAAAADVSIDTTAADILSASSGSITADDAGADKLVFWDDSAGKLTYLTVSTGLSISGTTFTASVSASDISQGTLAYARMADPTVTSPSQITANQNDYASFARGINRFTTNAARDITGMAAGNDGEVRVLTNVGTTTANTLTIKDQSTSSTAANRFAVPWAGDCVIPAGGSVVVFYDNTTARWRVV